MLMYVREIFGLARAKEPDPDSRIGDFAGAFRDLMKGQQMAERRCARGGMRGAVTPLTAAGEQDGVARRERPQDAKALDERLEPLGRDARVSP